MHTNSKSGFTSLYVIVIITILFSVIVASFIRFIIGGANDTLSSSLAKSAYDAALAGIEDTKLALKHYNSCKRDQTSSENCNDVINSIESSFQDTTNANCNGVAMALGYPADISEVRVGNSDSDSAYTCVALDNTLSDYRLVLSSSTTARIVPLRPNSDDGNDADAANKITGLRIYWFSQDNNTPDNYTFDGTNPPELSVNLFQTALNYTANQFNIISEENLATDQVQITLSPNRDAEKTHVNRSDFLSNNNKEYPIKCTPTSGGGEFACMATIELPSVIPTDGDSTRNPETFLLALSLSNTSPATEVSVQMCIDNDSIPGDCNHNGIAEFAEFKDVQILADSTGRASDVYSRVEARIEFSDIYYPFPASTLSQSSSNPLPFDSDPCDSNESNCMQNFICTEDATSGVTLYDARDKKPYTVKYINGNCWMTQNLDFRWTSNDTLVSASTNVTSNTKINVGALTTKDDGSFTEARIGDSTDPRLDPRLQDMTDPSYGTYYNFCAASAGTNCDKKTTGTKGDICPASWRLPTEDEINGITSFLSDFSPVSSGYYTKGILYAYGWYGPSDDPMRRDEGYWWSNTTEPTFYENSRIKNLHYNGPYNGFLSAQPHPATLHSTSSTEKYFGISVRCIKTP